MDGLIDPRQLQDTGQLEMLARQVVEGFITGLHKSPFHGFSVEFAEHRAYNKGESTRHIDWKLYARTEKLFVKRYEEETNLRCQIIIDCSSSMYFPQPDLNKSGILNKMSFSIYTASAIIQLLKKQRDAVGLSLFAEDISIHTRARSSTLHHKHLYSELNKVLQADPIISQKRTNAADSLHEISERINKRSLVVIFSDMMDNSDHQNDIFSALQHLKHNKHEVILFHVVDKKRELDFDFENRPYTFIDMESGEKVKVNPTEIKQTYLNSMGKFTKELKLRCAQYHIDFVEADINMGFNHILREYLVKRQRMM